MCQNFEEISLSDVESTFRSNILQMFAVTKYALPHMRKGGSYVCCVTEIEYPNTKVNNRVINTTSIVAFRGSGQFVDYTATKGAIVGFTRALAKQLTPKGIRVNAVA